jgi:CDP-diacylglycerol--serine O-phosphatidyltransferase
MRLARFNIQTATHVDKRYFVGMPTPAAAGIVAATVFAWPALPAGSTSDAAAAAAAVAVMLGPAALMVSTIKFRSFKTINFGWGTSYLPLLFFVVLVAVIATRPQVTLLLMAYAYMLSGFVEWSINRWRLRRESRSVKSA